MSAPNGYDEFSTDPGDYPDYLPKPWGWEPSAWMRERIAIIQTVLDSLQEDGGLDLREERLPLHVQLNIEYSENGNCYGRNCQRCEATLRLCGDEPVVMRYEVSPSLVIIGLLCGACAQTEAIPNAETFDLEVMGMNIELSGILDEGEE